MTEDKMAGWHHWHNGHEFEQAPGDSEGQGSLECYSLWSCKEWDTTEQLNNKGTDGAAAHQHSIEMCLKPVPNTCTIIYSSGLGGGGINTTVKTEVPA